jgi:hypothetical protein
MACIQEKEEYDDEMDEVEGDEEKEDEEEGIFPEYRRLLDAAIPMLQDQSFNP